MSGIRKKKSSKIIPVHLSVRFFSEKKRNGSDKQKMKHGRRQGLLIESEPQS